MTLAQRRSKGVYLEDLCFHAQQAAEKAIKSVLIHRSIEFPYVHDLGRLFDLAAERGIQIPAEVQPAHMLTRFAVVFRYPGIGQPLEVGDHERAVRLARAVVAWAERSVETYQPPDGES